MTSIILTCSSSSTTPDPTPHVSSSPGDTSMPPPSFLPAARKRKIAPAAPVPSPSPVPFSVSHSDNHDDDDDDDDADVDVDEYAPNVPLPNSTSISKRHPSKNTKSTIHPKPPGKPMSREALRRANHSLIERRRRDKINVALQNLRDMVPGLGADQGGKGGEFKLEVLERTVDHMRDLQTKIEELEARLDQVAPTGEKSKYTVSERIEKSTNSKQDAAHSPSEVDHAPKRLMSKGRSKTSKASETPPSPSLSPDPNETEPETNLPPPFTFASSSSVSPSHSHSPPHSTPSMSSLLNHPFTETRLALPSRPSPGPQATNPTLYLPFPTPSPTSPFLTYHTSTTTSSTASSNGPPDPSPFLAPLQNISLFGGALNLDHSPPIDKSRTVRVVSSKDVQAEEAANVLLAFSSPDTMRPIGMGGGGGSVGGMTPKMIPISGGVAGPGKRERRETLESEPFMLDEDTKVDTKRIKVDGGVTGLLGKTASEILRL